MATSQQCENIFTRKIFDKETGKSLVCKFHADDPPWQSFSMSWWDKQSIRFEEVMAQVIDFLRSEQQRAFRALEYLKSDDMPRQKHEKLSAIADEAIGLFEELKETEAPDMQLYQMAESGEIPQAEYENTHSAIYQKLTDADQTFGEVMQHARDLDKAFAPQNPWIKTFTDSEIPDWLTKDQVKKWVGRVNVEDLSTCQVLIPDELNSWKQMLPGEWVSDGGS